MLSKAQYMGQDVGATMDEWTSECQMLTKAQYMGQNVGPPVDQWKMSMGDAIESPVCGSRLRAYSA